MARMTNKAAAAKKPVRGAKKVVQEKPARSVKKARPAREEVVQKPAKQVRTKAVETKFLNIRSSGIASIEGTLQEVTAGFVTVAHKNRLRPGMTTAIKRSPAKALERGVSTPGPRHFVSTIPMSKVVSIHTLDGNTVVTYRSDVVVDRIAITGEITPMENNMLSIETVGGQTVIVSADNAEIVGEVTGGSGRTGTALKASAAKPAKKGRKQVEESEDEEDGDDTEDAGEEDSEEDAGEEDGDDTEDAGGDDDTEEAGSDDW